MIIHKIKGAMFEQKSNHPKTMNETDKFELRFNEPKPDLSDNKYQRDVGKLDLVSWVMVLIYFLSVGIISDFLKNIFETDYKFVELILFVVGALISGIPALFITGWVGYYIDRIYDKFIMHKNKKLWMHDYISWLEKKVEFQDNLLLAKNKSTKGKR